MVVTTPVHAELTSLAPALITRYHAHHHLGFAATQEKLYATAGQLPDHAAPTAFEALHDLVVRTRLA